MIAYDLFRKKNNQGQRHSLNAALIFLSADNEPGKLHTHKDGRFSTIFNIRVFNSCMILLSNGSFE